MLESVAWLNKTLNGGRYRVEELLGQGGMGQVYRAYDANLETAVVIKVPLPFLLQDAEFSARFLREMRSLVRLSHPHIVKIFDTGKHDELPYAVLQYLPGGDLSKHPKRTLVAALRSWLPPVARALDYVHAQGYIHRDVKPGNIMFDATGHSFLSDFGLAKVLAESTDEQLSRGLTRTGALLGTPEYMAPELILGKDYDGRSDQYSLALTVYEVLSGQRPFAGMVTSAIMVSQVTKIPTRLDKVATHVSPAIADVVQRALAKKPEERFETCAKFAQQLLTALNPPKVAIQGGPATMEWKKETPPPVAGDTAPSPKNVAIDDVGFDLSAPVREFLEKPPQRPATMVEPAAAVEPHPRTMVEKPGAYVPDERAAPVALVISKNDKRIYSESSQVSTWFFLSLVGLIAFGFFWLKFTRETSYIYDLFWLRIGLLVSGWIILITLTVFLADTKKFELAQQDSFRNWFKNGAIGCFFGAW